MSCGVEEAVVGKPDFGEVLEKTKDMPISGENIREMEKIVIGLFRYFKEDSTGQSFQKFLTLLQKCEFSDYFVLYWLIFKRERGLAEQAVVKFAEEAPSDGLLFAIKVMSFSNGQLSRSFLRDMKRNIDSRVAEEAQSVLDRLQNSQLFLKGGEK